MFKNCLLMTFFFLIETQAANGMEIAYVQPSPYAALLVKNSRGVFELTNEEVNARDDFGNTPLILAVKKGLCDVAHLLFLVNPDVDAVNRKSHNAMFYAIKGRYLTVIESLAVAKRFTEADWNCIIHQLISDQNDSVSINKLFHQTVKEGCKQLAEHLYAMSRAVDVNVIISEGKSSPLHVATKNGDTAMMAFLLGKGARVDDLDSERRTPLLVACSKGFCSGVKLLFDSGAQLDVKDIKGWRPLHLAAEAGDCELLELLFGKGVDINEAGYREETALNIAAHNGHIEAVRFLLLKGANLKKEAEPPYETSLSSAVWGGHREIFKILINAWVEKEVFLESGELHPLYPIGNEPSDKVKKIIHDGRFLHMVTLHNDKAFAQLLLDLGADVNVADPSGTTPLHYAAKEGYLDIISLLKDYGADLNAVGYLLATPLNNAVYEGHEEAVKLLIQCGADLNKQVTKVEIEEQKQLKFYGMSPLHIAAARGNARIVQLLVSSGANTKSVVPNGYTVLHAAYLGGHPELADLLISYGIDQYAKDDEGKMAYMYKEAGMVAAAVDDVGCIIS